MASHDSSVSRIGQVQFIGQSLYALWINLKAGLILFCMNRSHFYIIYVIIAEAACDQFAIIVKVERLDVQDSDKISSIIEKVTGKSPRLSTSEELQQASEIGIRSSRN